MSILLNKYAEMSQDQKDSLGKVSSKLRDSGCHLVTITSAMEIDGSRIRVDFKTDSGEEIDFTGFLTSKDPEKLEGQITRTMNQFTMLCNATGLKIQSVLAKNVPTTVTYKTGDVAATSFPMLVGKKLYITTTTVIEGDEKDPKKAYVNQEIDTYKFFDLKKRNGLEISKDLEEGLTMDKVAEEAKQVINIGYRWVDNQACINKQAALLEKLGGSATTTSSASKPIILPTNTDDI